MKLDEIIDGGKLLTLFRSIGLSVRMATKINMLNKMENLYHLSEKFSNKSSDISDPDN